MFFILYGCSLPDSQQLNDNKKNADSKSHDTFSLNGLWAMSGYVDSILTYRSISKFRMLKPAWFAILIKIDNDTIKSFGSIQDFVSPFNPKGDSLHMFEKTTAGHWILKLNAKTKNLELRNSGSKIDHYDTIVYALVKRPDLEFLIDSLDPIHFTSSSFTNYFHDQLYAGTYDVIGSSEQVTFYPSGQIKGFQDFRRYKVDNYFGTHHPYNNMDNITFYRKLPESSDNYDWELFKWEINDDTLILTQFNWELFTYQGRKFREYKWELSDVRIKMLKR